MCRVGGEERICVLTYGDRFIRYSEPAAVRLWAGSCAIREPTEGCFYFPAVCADLIRGAKEKNLKVKGPVRMPTKVRECPGQEVENGSWREDGEIRTKLKKFKLSEMGALNMK